MSLIHKILIAALLFSTAGVAAEPSKPDDPTGASGQPESVNPEPSKPDDPIGAATLPKSTESGTSTRVTVISIAPMAKSDVSTVKPDASSVAARYDGGLKFSTTDESYALKLSFRSQVRFESTRPLGGDGQFLSNFYVPRSRVQVEGHVFGADHRYRLEVGLGESGSFTFVKDMFIEKKLPDSSVVVRLGQWRRPFFRQEMVADFSAEFNERSIANEFAGGGRDLGAAVHNDYEKSPEGFEWVIGVFNGFLGGSDRPSTPVACTTDAAGEISCVNGRPANFPADFGPTIVARAGWNSARAKGYSDGDLEGGPLRYSVGAAYKIDLANFSARDKLSHGLELDWNIKAHGLSLSGGIVTMKIKATDPEYGFFVQPGMFVLPKRVQVAARFALTQQGPTVGDDRNRLEALGALNYYFHGHALKIASDFGILKFTGTDPTTGDPDDLDLRVRVMAQLQI